MSFMDILTFVPSPHEILRRAMSLLNSTTFLSSRRTIDIRRSPEEFDVDHDTGFMPRQPLPRLPAKYNIWETALANAQETLSLGEDDGEEAIQKRDSGALWRSEIASWAVLDFADIQTDKSALQRAHLVLAWLVHFYVHSTPPTEDSAPVHVPKSLAVPLVGVSRCLKIAPILTYADTVLWNWDLYDADKPLTMDNMHIQNTFSGTEAERTFYFVSAEVEFRGVEMLRIIDDYNNLPNLEDLASISKASRLLTTLKGVVDDMQDIFQSIRARCDPHSFYWDVRPWFEGADAKGPSSPGWIFDGVSDSHLLDLSGPSAGQSSVMHALDIFLDIDHKLRQRRYPAPTAENKKANQGFMERMRRYMPGEHRAYLAHLASTPRPIRELAQRTPALRDAYDGAVLSLKRLRDLHIRIVTLYIVTMSRSIPDARSGCPASAMLARLEANRAAGKGPVRGTGGNELSMLLKAGRDATRRAVLKEIQ